MASFRYLVALLIFAAPLANATPDANGYSAQYECRAGGPRCNVDVARLGSQACDQIVHRTDDDWSKITNNRSANVFCIEAGDHTSKGTLTIDFSGSSSRYKVLRYYRAGDTDDEPWHQSASEQAKIPGIKFLGAHFWLVHRLVFDTNYAPNSVPIHLADGHNTSSHIIINRVLAQHGWRQVYVQGAHDSHIQNSVIRESIRQPGVDSDGVGLNWAARDIYVVNNEIYQIHSHGFYIAGPNAGTANIVVENNDIYTDTSQYTNCHGSYTGTRNSPCADAEAAISLKTGGTAGEPVLLVHNRVWGYRRSDPNVCCISSAQGQLISMSSENESDPGARYVLVLNNILVDGQHGIQTPREGPSNNSIIGNILYGIKDYYSSVGRIGSWALASLSHWDNNEVYLNTVIDSDSWGNIGGGNTNLEVKCNVVIASGASTGSSPDGSMIVSHNAFFGTQELTTDAGTDVSRSIVTRSNNTHYPSGTIARFAPINSCRTGSEAACFLYEAVSAGTSGSGAASSCTSLGCEFSDGGVTWRAVRGSFFYKRKLRTVSGGELAFIPYARVHMSAPESRTCDTPLGRTRDGIGISDSPTL